MSWRSLTFSSQCPHPPTITVEVTGMCWVAIAKGVSVAQREHLKQRSNTPFSHYGKSTLHSEHRTAVNLMLKRKWGGGTGAQAHFSYLVAPQILWKSKGMRRNPERALENRSACSWNRSASRPSDPCWFTRLMASTSCPPPPTNHHCHRT